MTFVPNRDGVCIVLLCFSKLGITLQLVNLSFAFILAGEIAVHWGVFTIILLHKGPFVIHKTTVQ